MVVRCCCGDDDLGTSLGIFIEDREGSLKCGNWLGIEFGEVKVRYGVCRFSRYTRFAVLWQWLQEMKL